MINIKTKKRKKDKEKKKVTIFSSSFAEKHDRKSEKEEKADEKKQNLLIVGKKTDPQERLDEMNNWVASFPGFIEANCSTPEGPVILEVYQAAHMLNDNPFRWVNKSRQIGMSFALSGEGLSKSHLMDYYTKIFISINQEEANEKITYARMLYDSMPLSIKKRLVVDNKQSLEFEDHSGKMRSRTRLLSYPQREPRGKGGNTDVDLDEFAHYTWGNKIYIAAIPIIMRGTGILSMSSSPLGKEGLHYEIGNDRNKYPNYSRQYIYWWFCHDFVRPKMFDEAQEKAFDMSTEDRVYRYGNEKLVAVFESMDIDSFQQEFELIHLDESLSYFPIDLINSNCFDIEEDFSADPDVVGDKFKYPIMQKYPNEKFKLYKTIDEVALAFQGQKIGYHVLGGYDVGRRRDKGELIIMEEKGELQKVLFYQTFNKVPYPDQIEKLKYYMKVLPFMRLGIDATGPGGPVSEALKSEFLTRVRGIDFSLNLKSKMASFARLRMENQNLAIPDLKDLKRQIHSIKRKVTDAGNITFDAEKNKEHHGDKFWALAIASFLGKSPFMAKVRVTLPKADLSKQQRDDMIKRVVSIPQVRLAVSYGLPSHLRPGLPMRVGSLVSAPNFSFRKIEMM